MRGTLEKRLQYLFTGESMSIVGFIIVSYLLQKANPNLQLYSLYSFWFSFFILEFLLAQGVMYWYTKWKRLKTEKISVTPIQMVRRLKVLQKWNITLIFAAPIPFIIDIMIWYPSLPMSGLSIALFIYLFSILEYINYFHIQLSYDNSADLQYLKRTKRLKRASLSRDFERLNSQVRY